MKNKFLRKAILPSVVALGAAVASLSSATYAWFTKGVSATVVPFVVDVEDASGLSIGIDNYDDTNDIFQAFTSKVDLSAAKLANDSDWEMPTLVGVSSAGTVDTTGKLMFYSASLDTTLANDPISKITASANPSVLSFDLYVENYGEAKGVMLKGSTIEFKGAAGGIGAETAVRMAFVNNGVYDSSKGVGQRFVYDETLNVGYVDESNKGTRATIWEPNSEVHTANGKKKYALAKGVESSTVSGKIDTFACDKAGDFSASPLDRFAADAGNNLVLQNTITDVESTFFNVASDGTTKITVYLWLEGQDMDCLNDIATAEFEVSLRFQVVGSTEA